MVAMLLTGLVDVVQVLLAFLQVQVHHSVTKRLESLSIQLVLTWFQVSAKGVTRLSHNHEIHHTLQLQKSKLQKLQLRSSAHSTCHIHQCQWCAPLLSRQEIGELGMLAIWAEHWPTHLLQCRQRQALLCPKERCEEMLPKMQRHVPKGMISRLRQLVDPADFVQNLPHGSHLSHFIGASRRAFFRGFAGLRSVRGQHGHLWPPRKFSIERSALSGES
mmetsp:Transcript_36898/g.79491  ORF Transcript_36898/g.79491 Transcript_36898/m.79491 type:complete len:218 (-) Transcript_36898:87-740(-)